MSGRKEDYRKIDRREFFSFLRKAGTVIGGVVLVGCWPRERGDLSRFSEIGEAAWGQACMYTIQGWELEENPKEALENVARAFYGRENGGMWPVLEVIRKEDGEERCYAVSEEGAERKELPYLNPTELQVFDIVTTPKDCQGIVSERNQ